MKILTTTPDLTLQTIEVSDNLSVHLIEGSIGLSTPDGEDIRFIEPPEGFVFDESDFKHFANELRAIEEARQREITAERIEKAGPVLLKQLKRMVAWSESGNVMNTHRLMKPVRDAIALAEGAAPTAQC